MKNFMKKVILTVLAIAIVVTCIPVTAQAKDKFKWTKSAILKGKQYKVASDETSEYEVCLWSDREAELTVKTYNGAVTAYCKTYQDDWGVMFQTGKPEKLKIAYENCKDDFYSELGVKAKYLKKNKTYKIPVRRGFNALCIRACKDANVKIGQTYKCKITATDANIVVLSSKRNIYGNTIKNMFPSKKTFNSFAKWVRLQDISLCGWMLLKDSLCEELAYCMVATGRTEYDASLFDTNYKEFLKSRKAFAKVIEKEIDTKVEKSKYSGGKILSYEEAIWEYIDSQEGLVEDSKAMEEKLSYAWDDVEYYIECFNN